jgi:hypothetical protein
MKTSFENIYEHIGYLFYAIVFEHRKASAFDYEKLKSLIEQNWQIPIVDADLEHRLLTYLYTGIKNAADVSMDAVNAYGFFVQCFELNSFAFGQALRHKLISVANVIAQEFPVIGELSLLPIKLELRMKEKTAVSA